MRNVRCRVAIVSVAAFLALLGVGCGGKIEGVDDVPPVDSPRRASAGAPEGPSPAPAPGSNDGPARGRPGRPADKPSSLIDGVWLIGFAGGMNHFSWLRFTFDDEVAGRVDFRDGASLSHNAPVWACNGRGAFQATSKGGVITVTIAKLPDGCTGVPKTFVFSEIRAGAPAGGLSTAAVEVTVEPTEQTGFRYPRAWCDVEMTSCRDPFDR